MSYRTHRLGELRKQNVGQSVKLSGWADTVRDHGGLLFIDLRDRYGTTQVVFNPEHKDAYELAQKVRSEFVISIEGAVKLRSQHVNKDLATGEIEVHATSLEILNKSVVPPFEVGSKDISESLKLKYRYITLRGEDAMLRMEKRAKMGQVIRNHLDKQSFLELETPILTKSTPEGARDFLVPSRLNENKFYALPQSPQIFKQLFMVAGIDRYYQIAKCFRDEDLRADRQPEFTQLDIELSFTNVEEVMTLGEDLLKNVAKELIDVDLGTLDRLTYDDAMDRYGSDKPDTRFGLKLVNLSDIAAKCSFKVFNDVVNKGGLVKGINVKGLAEQLSRKDIDDLTKDISKFGARGLAWIKVEESGLSSVIAKFFTEEELKAMADKMGAEPGDILFFVADSPKVVHDSLGNLRLILRDKFNLVEKGTFKALWVTDFPLLEWLPEEKRYKAMHHPFTSPSPSSPLDEKDLNKIKSLAYDLVLNGNEIAGGSIRIHDVDVQKQVFALLGIDSDAAEDKFGHLLGALRHGAPPHGGIAFGYDRTLAVLMEDDSIRDVIPFPKTQKGQCLVTDAPAAVVDLELMDLHVKNIKKANKE